MDAYPEIYSVNRTRHNTTRGSVLVPENMLLPQVYFGMHMGPWGWQWEDGVHDIISASPSSRPITLDALMDGVEEVGALERTWVSRIANENHLDYAWDIQNYRGLCLLKIARMPFHCPRAVYGGSPQPAPSVQEDLTPT